MKAGNKAVPEIKRFVRKQLGCKCPDEVFSSIEIIHKPDVFSSLPVDYLLEIGGRLLLAVVTCDIHLIPACLKEIINTGRLYRDSHGFNRFRLVVAIKDNEIQDAIQSAYDLLALNDEKIHLHIIDPASIDSEYSRAISRADNS